MPKRIQDSSSTASSSMSVIGDGDTNMTVIAPPAKRIQDGSISTASMSICVIGDGDSNMAVIAPPALMPTNRSPRPQAKDVMIYGDSKEITVPDEEMGEEYDLHFGTTVIDEKGAAHHDPTVKLLILGGSCLFVAMVTIVMLLLLQPWASESTGMTNPIIEEAGPINVDNRLVGTTFVPTTQEEEDSILEPILEPEPKRADTSSFP